MAYIAPGAIQPGAGTRPQPVIQFLRDTIGAAGQVTSPGATTVIATLTPGFTDPSSTGATVAVQIMAGFGAGSPAAVDINNMRVRVDGTVLSVLSLPAVNGLYYFTFIVTVTSVQAIDVQAIGAGTLGVVYTAGIYPTQIR